MPADFAAVFRRARDRVSLFQVHAVAREEYGVQVLKILSLPP